LTSRIEGLNPQKKKNNFSKRKPAHPAPAEPEDGWIKDNAYEEEFDLNNSAAERTRTYMPKTAKPIFTRTQTQTPQRKLPKPLW
jgi:hypothetical protein